MPVKVLTQAELIPEALPPKFAVGQRVKHTNADKDTFEGEIVKIIPQWQFVPDAPMKPYNSYLVKFDGYDEQEIHTDKTLKEVGEVKQDSGEGIKQAFTVNPDLTSPKGWETRAQEIVDSPPPQFDPGTDSDYIEGDKGWRKKK